MATLAPACPSPNKRLQAKNVRLATSLKHSEGFQTLQDEHVGVKSETVVFKEKLENSEVATANFQDEQQQRLPRVQEHGTGEELR